MHETCLYSAKAHQAGRQMGYTTFVSTSDMAVRLAGDCVGHNEGCNIAGTEGRGRNCDPETEK